MTIFSNDAGFSSSILLRRNTTEFVFRRSAVCFTRQGNDLRLVTLATGASSFIRRQRQRVANPPPG